jgi:hypothetical protein
MVKTPWKERKYKKRIHKLKFKLTPEHGKDYQPI